MAKAAAKPKIELITTGVYQDFNSRTCIKVDEVDGTVFAVPLDIEGLKVVTFNATDFNQIYKLMPNYPIGKACGLYLSYAKTLGAEPGVLEYFDKFITVPEEDRIMATTKQREKSLFDADTKKTRAPKEKAVKAEKPMKPIKEAKPTKVSKATPTDGPKSAAQMFKDLIMEGKLSDDQIFAQVQVAFGLDDSKRSYVQWYRNKMQKDGLNPPAKKA